MCFDKVEQIIEGALIYIYIYIHTHTHHINALNVLKIGNCCLGHFLFLFNVGVKLDREQRDTSNVRTTIEWFVKVTHVMSQ